MVKICQECKKEFETNNGMQKFCNDKHYRKCVICGKEFEVTRYHLTAQDAKTTCSRKCSSELRKRTNVNKYGGVAPACSKDIRDKMEATTEARYGVKHAAQAQQFKDKSVSTCLTRYGVSHHSKTSEGRARVSNQWKNNEFKAKVMSNIEKTNIERYGSKYAMQSNDVKHRFIKAHMNDSTYFSNFIQFKENPRSFISELNINHKPTIFELCSVLGVNESTVGKYIHAHNCEDVVDLHVSVMEQEVAQFLRSICPEIKIEHNVRSIINPYELDIYLPEYYIGIECNPTATHNSSINVFDNDNPPMSSNYHINKTNKCEDNKVFLFHIFGYEWNYKRKIIESMLCNLINKNSYRIYARNTEIRHVSWFDAKCFLDANHRQGNANSKVRLGLYYKDELVALMTFGKVRNTIGTSSNENLDNCWELVRFCSKLNTSVIGGAGKLFCYFIKTFNPERIRSFSDRAHTKGELYVKLGFTEIRRSSPGYMWVDIKTDIAYNRYNAQKQNILNFLKDDSIDLSKTEKQLMEEHGFVQVFDSGTITWEWKK